MQRNIWLEWESVGSLGGAGGFKLEVGSFGGRAARHDPLASGGQSRDGSTRGRERRVNKTILVESSLDRQSEDCEHEKCCNFLVDFSFSIAVRLLVGVGFSTGGTEE